MIDVNLFMCEIFFFLLKQLNCISFDFFLLRFTSDNKLINLLCDATKIVEDNFLFFFNQE